MHKQGLIVSSTGIEKGRVFSLKRIKESMGTSNHFYIFIASRLSLRRLIMMQVPV